MAGRALMGAANAFAEPDSPGRARGGGAVGRSGTQRRHVRGRPGRRVSAWPPCSAVRSARRAGVSPSPSRRQQRSCSRSAGCDRYHEPPGSSAGDAPSLLNRWMGLVAAKAAAAYLGFTAIGLSWSRCRRAGVRARLVRRPGSSWPRTASGGMRVRALRGHGRGPVGRPWTALLGTLASAAGVLGLAFVAECLVAGARLLRRSAARPRSCGPALNTIVVESVSGEPGRRGIRLQRLQVRRRGHRAARLRADPRRRHPPAVPVATASPALTAMLVPPWFRRYRRRAQGRQRPRNPLTAWRIRASFSTSAKRTNPSPPGPKPMPGRRRPSPRSSGSPRSRASRARGRARGSAPRRTSSPAAWGTPSRSWRGRRRARRAASGRRRSTCSG